ncbi:hypothetical protein RRG08_014278 [Elysia crispata]|uniref:Uncharacterized protein n=1 Tax=Elysia crispata TaxID=231223 RepID=A0AAE1CQS2_9GAST|nr:hypothetical protein RRG08_014278 [Elysia crispata]
MLDPFCCFSALGLRFTRECSIVTAIYLYNARERGENTRAYYKRKCRLCLLYIQPPDGATVRLAEAGATHLPGGTAGSKSIPRPGSKPSRGGHLVSRSRLFLFWRGDLKNPRCLTNTATKLARMRRERKPQRSLLTRRRQRNRKRPPLHPRLLYRDGNMNSELFSP